MFLDRGMVGRLPLKRMSRRSVGKSADDKRDRPCRFVSLPLQAVRRGGGPCANAAIRFRGDRSGGFRQRHSLFLYRARFRRADRLVNLGYRIRGFRTVCRTDVSCFRQAGLARFASVPNNNFHWKFVLLENSRTFVVWFPMEIIDVGNFRAKSFKLKRGKDGDSMSYARYIEGAERFRTGFRADARRLPE